MAEIESIRTALADASPGVSFDLALQHLRLDPLNMAILPAMDQPISLIDGMLTTIGAYGRPDGQWEPTHGAIVSMEWDTLP